jgi:hypothetical protein
MAEADKEESALKAKQAKLLNALDNELSKTKVLSMSLKDMKGEQHKILGDYRA